MKKRRPTADPPAGHLHPSSRPAPRPPQVPHPVVVGGVDGAAEAEGPHEEAVVLAQETGHRSDGSAYQDQDRGPRFVR